MTPQTEITRWSDLTSDQQQAMLTLLEKMEQGQSLLSLSGHAGTGKTTALRVLVDLLVDRGIIPVVVTPTNKAATVLQSKGVSAATVFARFFTLEEVSRRPKKMTFVPNYQLEKLGAGKISQADVVIVDEGSMLNSWVLKHLQKMADILILVGDGAQLPPVGDIDNPRGYFCTRKHDAELTQVLRNDGAVLHLATAVRTSQDGRRIGLDIDAYYPGDDFETLFVLNRPQLICWRNVIRRALNVRARKTLGITGVLPVPGDLMICRDNYDDLLLNGTQATLESFTWDGSGRTAEVVLVLSDGTRTLADMDMLRFFEDQPPAQVRQYLDLIERYSHGDEEGAALTYGYAITAHAAQGGEWPHVVVVDEREGIYSTSKRNFAENPRNVPPDDACRRWAYTAISRARETVYVADERWMKY